MFTFYMNKRTQGLFDACREPTLACIEAKVLHMRKTAVFLLPLMIAPGFAQAAVECPSATVPQAAPLRPTVIAPVSSELAASSYQLGAQVSVLSQAYDESQSADQVLLRLRIEGCQNVAKAIPAPSAIQPDDPAAYKPQTEFDNTPWRFDMSQNGKRMTADEFSAWMESRGVRVARGATPAAAEPAAAAAPGTPAGAAPTGAAPPASGMPPGTEPAGAVPPPAPGMPPGTVVPATDATTPEAATAPAADAAVPPAPRPAAEQPPADEEGGPAGP